MPERVQRRRTKGEPGIPPGAVYVGRPSKWGNPFRAGDGRIYKVGSLSGMALTPDHAVRLYRVAIRRGRYKVHAGPTFEDIRWIEHQIPTVTDIRRELAGRDLACWCAPGQPCHGDVQLAVANGP